MATATRPFVHVNSGHYLPSAPEGREEKGRQREEGIMEKKLFERGGGRRRGAVNRRRGKMEQKKREEREREAD